MMACFGSVAHAPLAVMIMVAEMTGSFSVIPGAMIAVGIAYLLIITLLGVDLPGAAAQPRKRGGGTTPRSELTHGSYRFACS